MFNREISTAARLNSDMKLSEAILQFYNDLKPPKMPKGVAVMNPYRDAAVSPLIRAFYRKYYHDTHPRILMLGINPGRFGSGTTGISFTDPIRLETNCGIANTLAKKPELSSDFIYRMIEAYGGPKSFYSRYFISAVSPLGFTREGKNINYYDDKKLQTAVRPFAVSCIQQLVDMGVDTMRCYCIGEGKNYTFLAELNEEHRWFGEITPLAHPRFIMQYRRKQLEDYIRMYTDRLG
jgi:hypothetical protein